LEFLNSLKSKENIKKKIAIITGLLFVTTAFIIVYWLYGKQLWAFVSDAERFRAWLRQYGRWGEVLFVGIRAFQTVIKIIPAEPLEIGAGYVFGTWWGLLWCMLGTEIGSAVIIILTKIFGMKMVEVFVPKEKIESLSFLNNQKKLGVTLFIIYLIPGTPKDVITYLIGLTPMKLWVFLVLTGIARIPSIVTSTMCGEALGVKNWTAAIIIYAVTAVASVIGIYLYKRLDNKAKLKAKGNFEELAEEDISGGQYGEK
jgi:uncharacterized membrane protein YdjX (TVP38/TMEM64 family)